MFRFSIQQELLAGFGFGPNLRYLRIAKNNKKISDIAFKDQIIATVTQIENIYWDLVSAYEQTRVNEQSSAFAQQTFDNAKKQFQLESIPEMDVMRAEAEVSRRDQDLIVARTSLELQETLMKNAVTKSLDDPVLEAMPVIPTDHMQGVPAEAVPSIQDLISSALQGRPELSESDIDLANRRISRQAARNALLPSLSLVGFWGSSGLAGPLNPVCGPACTSSVPTDFGGALQNAFNDSSPDYYLGVNMNIPIRNRVAKADQYRSELEYRQAELRMEQLKKQVRIEVRNAQYAVQQNRASVDSAKAALDLARQSLDAEQKKYQFGTSTTTLVLQYQSQLATAESTLVNATVAYEKSRIELDRATGNLLDHNGISMDDAARGQVTRLPNVPYITPRKDLPSVAQPLPQAAAPQPQ